MRRSLPLVICLAGLCFPASSCITTPVRPGSGLLEIHIWGEDEYAGASLYLDDKFVGRMCAGRRPAVLRAAAGTHSLRVTADGYEPWEQTISVPRGPVKYNVQVRLKKRPRE